MRILYFYRVPVPTTRAGAIQAFNTCSGLSRSGGDVTLHVEAIRAPSTTACLSYYGIEDPIGTGRGSLAIIGLGRHWARPFLAWKTRNALGPASGRPACLFVREVRRYVPTLIDRARAAGLKVIFEAHNVSASLVNEKRDKAVRDDSQSAGRHQALVSRRLQAESSARSALETSILLRADGLICTQRTTLERLRSFLRPGTAAAVLGNAAQPPPAGDPVAERDIDVLYCGSLKPWKGVDTLVSALEHLPSGKLTVIGPAEPADVRRLRGLALDAGTADRLTILPAVPPGRVWSLYARAKVGVVPLPGSGFVEARYFTSPLKLFEMMAAGLPVVASRLPSIQEYAVDGREILLVEPGDPRSLAAGLRRLLDDESLRTQLGGAARSRAAQSTWDARGVKILAFAEALFR
ncbi:MAG: glycosyltransferase family 4 protein [Acidobacteriota bacterium]